MTQLVKVVDVHKINLWKVLGCAWGIVEAKNDLGLQLTVLQFENKTNQVPQL